MNRREKNTGQDAFLKPISILSAVSMILWYGFFYSIINAVDAARKIDFELIVFFIKNKRLYVKCWGAKTP